MIWQWIITEDADETNAVKIYRLRHLLRERDSIPVRDKSGRDLTSMTNPLKFREGFIKLHSDIIQINQVVITESLIHVLQFF